MAIGYPNFKKGAYGIKHFEDDTLDRQSPNWAKSWSVTSDLNIGGVVKWAAIAGIALIIYYKVLPDLGTTVTGSWCRFVNWIQGKDPDLYCSDTGIGAHSCPTGTRWVNVCENSGGISWWTCNIGQGLSGGKCIPYGQDYSGDTGSMTPGTPSGDLPIGGDPYDPGGTPSVCPGIDFLLCSMQGGTLDDTCGCSTGSQINGLSCNCPSGHYDLDATVADSMHWNSCADVCNFYETH